MITYWERDVFLAFRLCCCILCVLIGCVPFQFGVWYITAFLSTLYILNLMKYGMTFRPPYTHLIPAAVKTAKEILLIWMYQTNVVGDQPSQKPSQVWLPCLKGPFEAFLNKMSWKIWKIDGKAMIRNSTSCPRHQTGKERNRQGRQVKHNVSSR